MLVADVLGRIHEEVLDRHVVSAALGQVAELPSAFAQLARSCELEVPRGGYESTAALAEALGGPPSAEVVSTDDTQVSGVAGLEPIVIRVGPVAAAPGLVRPLVERSTPTDPLALRLALLRFPHLDPAALSAARLRRADETLDRWRFKVASWKDIPPARTGARASLLDALVTGFDTATVLRQMHRMEVDHTIASGDKFTAFVELDQVLGLDLRRYVGYIR
jgi:hypothetical protein